MNRRHRRMTRAAGAAAALSAIGLPLLSTPAGAGAVVSPNADYAARLLDVLEGTELPDPGRVSDLAAQLDGGASRSSVVDSIINGAAYRGEVVDRLYADILGRDADSGGRDHWIGRLASGVSEYQVRGSFFSSDEFLAGGDTTSFVTDLYQVIVERAPDTPGLDYWVSQTGGGAFSRFFTALRFQQTDEARGIETVELFERILARTPDAGGRAYFAEALRTDGIEATTRGIAASAELAATSQIKDTALVLLPGNQIAVVDPQTLAFLQAPVTIATTGATAQLGITAGTALVALDVRPHTGAVYGLGSDGQLYSIGYGSGTATKIGAPIAQLAGLDVGLDFNPTVDRIRAVTSNGVNLRLNPDTGGVAATDTTLAYAGGDANAGATPIVVGAAYTNSAIGQPLPSTTQLFDVDSGTDALVLQNPPNNGALNTVGPLGTDVGNGAGLDISPLTGRAYLVDDTTAYRVDLGSGHAIEQADNGLELLDLAILGGAANPAGEALVLSSDGTTHTVQVVNVAAPGSVLRTFTITGVNAATTLQGIDVRGATGMPHVLGSDGQLYVLGAPKAATPSVLPAEKVGAPIPTAFTGPVGLDFNPAVDRLRFLAGTNSRVLNPNNGAETLSASTTYAVGDPNAAATPNIRAGAYANDLRGGGNAASTTLFDVDPTLDILATHNVTTGVLTTVGALGLNVGDNVSFDIQPGSGTAFLFHAGSLYTVNLATGAVTLVGTVPAPGATGFALR